MQRTYKNVNELIKMIEEKYLEAKGNIEDHEIQVLYNQGIPEASKKGNFVATLISRKKKGDYVKFTYFYDHPSNFSQSGWNSDNILFLGQVK